MISSIATTLCVNGTIFDEGVGGCAPLDCNYLCGYHFVKNKILLETLPLCREHCFDKYKLIAKKHCGRDRIYDIAGSCENCHKCHIVEHTQFTKQECQYFCNIPTVASKTDIKPTTYVLWFLPMSYVVILILFLFCITHLETKKRMGLPYLPSCMPKCIILSRNQMEMDSQYSKSKIRKKNAAMNVPIEETNVDDSLIGSDTAETNGNVNTPHDISATNIVHLFDKRTESRQHDSLAKSYQYLVADVHNADRYIAQETGISSSDNTLSSNFGGHFGTPSRNGMISDHASDVDIANGDISASDNIIDAANGVNGSHTYDASVPNTKSLPVNAIRPLHDQYNDDDDCAFNILKDVSSRLPPTPQSWNSRKYTQSQTPPRISSSASEVNKHRMAYIYDSRTDIASVHRVSFEQNNTNNTGVPQPVSHLTDHNIDYQLSLSDNLPVIELVENDSSDNIDEVLGAVGPVPIQVADEVVGVLALGAGPISDNSSGMGSYSIRYQQPGMTAEEATAQEINELPTNMSLISNIEHVFHQITRNTWARNVVSNGRFIRVRFDAFNEDHVRHRIMEQTGLDERHFECIYDPTDSPFTSHTSNIHAYH